MTSYYGQPAYGHPSGPAGGSGAHNLQFYPSSYAPSAAGTHHPSSGGGYGFGMPAGVMSSGGSGGGAGPGFSVGGSGVGGGVVSGRMGGDSGLRTGWLAAFSTEGYEGEPPLLEELGVNFGHIQMKTLAVLNPFSRIDQHIMDDSDLAGPVLFFLLFGTFLLFSGKVHFGYIYGLALLGSILLHAILSLMTPDGLMHDPTLLTPGSSSSSAVAASSSGVGYGMQPHHVGPSGVPGAHSQMSHGEHGQHDHDHHSGKLSSTLTLARSASVLGYCLLPLVTTSLVGVVAPMDTPLGITLTTFAILWCTYSASAMFCAVGRMRGMRALVAYPLALFYAGFGIMGIFSSRGSGHLAKAAALGKAA